MSTPLTYHAPVAGIYEVRTNSVRYEDTGLIETVSNEHRRWFQFWKPKLITRKVYRKVSEMSSREYVRVKAGEIIENVIERVGS